MKVGIQLYSVQTEMAKDPVEAIKQVVKTGYRYLEVANHNAAKDPGVGFGVPAGEMKKLLNDLDAQVVSAHVFPLQGDNLGPVLEYHQEIGTKFMILPMGFFTGRDSALEMADTLNKVGEKCAEAGMEMLYHNHFHEFQKFEGETVLETMMANTDPALVKLELDTYWAMRGGQDPVAVLKQYGKRVRLIHQKDYPAGYEGELDMLATVGDGEIIDMQRFAGGINPDTFIEIGKGIMDIQSIIDTANEACGTEYVILEQDHTKNQPMDSIRISMESFRGMKGISW